MGDTVTEVKDVISEVEAFLPTITGILGAFVPGSAGLLTLASPFLSIANEILSAIETLKAGGLTHHAAAAVVGAAVTHIGQTISSAVPAGAAQAAADGTPLAPDPGSVKSPTPIPIPHETH